MTLYNYSINFVKIVFIGFTFHLTAIRNKKNDGSL